MSQRISLEEKIIDYLNSKSTFTKEIGKEGGKGVY